MDFRRTARNVALGLLGLVAAVAIGLAANTISGDSVGLSAQPLSAGEALAPPAADQTAARSRRERRTARRRQRNDGALTGTSTVETQQPRPAGGTSGTSGDDAVSGSPEDGGSGRSGSSGSSDDTSGSEDSGQGRGRGRGRGSDD